MSAEVLLQFVIRLGVLGTHDTKLLRIVEVEPEYIFFLGYFSLVCNDFNTLKLFLLKFVVLIHFRLSSLSNP